ncbi:MAG: hypothetical protein ACRCUP_04575 [Mycoplasmatales bacterium]
MKKKYIIIIALLIGLSYFVWKQPHDYSTENNNVAVQNVGSPLYDKAEIQKASEVIKSSINDLPDVQIQTIKFDQKMQSNDLNNKQTMDFEVVFKTGRNPVKALNKNSVYKYHYLLEKNNVSGTWEIVNSGMG